MKKTVSGAYLPKPEYRLDSEAPLLGKLGLLETRLARTKTEICTAQTVRYQVFYEELGAIAPPEMRLVRRDRDRFDQHCDHLLVIDRSSGNEEVVGTYRLLLDKYALVAGGYYSESEFDLSLLKHTNRGKRLMELGRSCILPDYRSKRVMELLWQGTWAYAVNNKIDILFGCASFSGTDPQKHSTALSWLAGNAMLESGDCPATVADSVDLTKVEDTGANGRRVLAALPPLLKGYLRLGAKVASHAVVDHQFGTTDVLVVLRVADISPRYLAHYGVDASRFAA